MAHEEYTNPSSWNVQTCQNSQFSRSLVKSVYHGTESISYLGPKIWDIKFGI